MHNQEMLRAAVPLFAILSLASAQEAPEPSLNVVKGQAAVRGIVRENVKRCEVDGACYLILGKSVPVRLYYHHGEYPPCSNPSSTKTGLSIKAGDRVEAVGAHSLAVNIHIVDLCCAGCKLVVLHTRK